MNPSAELPAEAEPVNCPSSELGSTPAPEVKPSPGRSRTEPLVDPTVARAKFERQVADYRQMEREYIRRGWLMVRAEFPEVVVLFAAPQLAPAAVLFGVVLDFTNYDLWAPSVRFVDPFTLEPLHATQAPPILKRPAAGAPLPLVQAGGDPAGARRDGEGSPHAAPNEEVGPPGPPAALQLVLQPGPQNLVQAHEDGVPFLCMAGVREYHEHPVHSNDPWLAHRAAGVGTLVHILNVIYRHGIQPLQKWKYQVACQVQVAGVEIDLTHLPE